MKTIRYIISKGGPVYEKLSGCLVSKVSFPVLNTVTKYFFFNWSKNYLTYSIHLTCVQSFFSPLH